MIGAFRGSHEGASDFNALVFISTYKERSCSFCMSYDFSAFMDSWFWGLSPHHKHSSDAFFISPYCHYTDCYWELFSTFNFRFRYYCFGRELSIGCTLCSWYFDEPYYLSIRFSILALGRESSSHHMMWLFKTCMILRWLWPLGVLNLHHALTDSMVLSLLMTQDHDMWYM